MNSAWAWAKKGSWDAARTLLDRGRGQFAAADHTRVPDWARFFTATDLSALTGAVHTDLAQTVDRQHARTAVPLLVEAIDGYGDDMARSRAFSLILLSTGHLVEGDVDQGVAIGFKALVSAGTLGSARVRDRIRPPAPRPPARLPRRGTGVGGARQRHARSTGRGAGVNDGPPSCWGGCLARNKKCCPVLRAKLAEHRGPRRNAVPND